MAGAFSVGGCGDDFNHCDASRTCPSPSGGAGAAGRGSAGAGGSAGGAASGGSSTGGKAGASGDATKGDAGAESGGAGAGGEASGADTGGRGALGGGVGQAGGEAGEAGADSAQRGPVIVDVTPANYATGVSKDAEIVIDFDQPMDEETTKAAYQSLSLPPSSVEFSWRNHDKSLVFLPTAPLEYVRTDVDGDAKAYVFTIAGTAASVKGRHLAADYTSSFTTLRDIAQSLSVSRGYWYSGLPTETPEYAVKCDYLLGEDIRGNSDFGVMLFDLSRVAPGVTDWVSASMNFKITNYAPVAAALGPLHLYGSTADPTTFTRSSPRTNLGVIAPLPADTSEPAPASLSVTSTIASDYTDREKRGNVAEFAALFESESDGNEIQAANLQCENIELDLEYLAP